jgi:chemotaxis protein MotB
MATTDDKRPLIVVRKVKRGGGGHHGGAWKIAYADFVTAMMAFFLLMWLLASTSKGDLQGVAQYFRTPMRVGLSGGTAAGDATSILQGGGKDLTRKVGQISIGEPSKGRQLSNLQAVEAELARQEENRLKQLKSKIEKEIDASPSLRTFKEQLKIELTPEGLRIQILDEKNRPMFDLGSAHLKDYTRVILRELAKLLNEVEQKIMLSGHTDATPYASGERAYSNWELSADRANASRRELIAGGMDESKILRVVGLSSAVPFNREDPLDPSNRRISITVTNRKTEALIRRDGVATGMLEPGNPGAAPVRSQRPPSGGATSPQAAPVSADNSGGWPARR